MSHYQTKHAALCAELNEDFKSLQDALLATGTDEDILIKAIDVEEAAQRLWTVACSIRRNLVKSKVKP